VIAPGGQAFRQSHAIFLRRHGKAAFGFPRIYPGAILNPF
jgi:hypothetical protein